ncbi:MAG: NAD(P)H-dependent oxidoreductase [Ruminococcus sp.]|nr:NAD(P)H-dependent oxidoreductase [Ruminococcus sp.]
MSKNLIVYYSRRGENYVNGNIVDLPKGNTEICAEYIQNTVGGDLFEVRTVNQYSADYTKCTEQAKQELEVGARPKLEKYLDDISEYDNVFILSPCWWGTYPMAVFSLLERLNFKGKKVMTLMTHEGSGMGSSERDLRRLCTGAVFGTSMAVHGADAEKSENAIAAWAKKNIAD